MEMDYSATANESGIGAAANGSGIGASANESGIGDQVGSSASPTVPTNSAPKWSAVWNEFSILKAEELKDYEEKLGITRTRERAKCMHCGKVLIAETKSGTSALGRHLERCPERPNNLNESGGNRNIDHNVCREMIAEAVIEHGYPFEWVEHKKTRNLCYYLNKKFKPVCRNTCKADCWKVHKKMKDLVKSDLEKVPGRISLTCDLWSSCTSDGYLCLTAHYIDSQWNLCSKILNFCHVAPPHTANLLYSHIYDLLKEWGIDRKIFSITLDNASNMDNMQRMLCSQLDQQEALVCNGKYFHIRCSAHILNLIVQVGLDVIRESLVKVRNCVKYVEGSEARKIKFRECVVQAGLSYSRGLWLDVATRWNSTYLMLERFLFYRSAFRNLARADQSFSFLLPDEREFPWLESIFTFLKPFYDITNLFSGRDYPTANLYFENVWQIQRNIDKELISEDSIMRAMATTMKAKFSKYWDEHTLVLSFAAILDPRYKIQFLQYSLPQLGAQYANKAECILVQMKVMFEEYQSQNGIFPQSSVLNDNVEQAGCQRRVISQDMSGFNQFDFHSSSNRSELDIYLGEAREDYNKEIDILEYWKSNQSRFPILSRMAMDLLCIPITTVASESAFSMGGRIINKWRNCLLTENAEMLITTRNWLYGYEVEENAATVFGRGIAKAMENP